MSDKFNAVLADKDEEGNFSVAVKLLDVGDLPDQPVLVDIEYSTVNYKDGLALTNSVPICQTFPMVCGIDLAGTVIESDSEAWAPGDRVLANGFGLSERFWGAYSQKQRINPDFLVRLPELFSSQQAMALGTAGYTAMLCVNAIRDHGSRPSDGPVLVTGSAGGVGSVAIMLLSALGYEPVASTGRPETEAYLRDLGAIDVIERGDLAKRSRPLDKAKWGAVVDSVGSTTLATALAQTRYNGVVAACGLAGGVDLPTGVMPFIVRNVRLQGCDSVMAPMSLRVRAWDDLAELVDRERLDAVYSVEPLGRVPELATKILAGQIRGRVVIDVNG